MKHLISIDKQKNLKSRNNSNNPKRLKFGVLLGLLLFFICFCCLNGFVLDEKLVTMTKVQAAEIEDETSNTESATEPTTAPTPSTQPTPTESTPTKPDPEPNIGVPYLLVGENAIIKGDVGTSVKLTLPLLNLGNAAAVDITASPILASKDEDFPFEIEKSEYLQSLSGSLEPMKDPNLITQATKTIDFGNFQIRKNLNSGYYRVSFKISYRSALDSNYQQIERYFFIKVNNPDQQGNDSDKEPPTDPDNSYDSSIFDGGNYGGGSFDSGSDNTNNATPRLLITGFSTNPDKIFGGEEFDLDLKLKNTSKEMAISNIKITMLSQGEEATFLPLDGASTIYIESIEKNTEQSINLKLKSNPTVDQKIYPLILKFEYEDKKGNSYNSEEMISLMINQKLRCDIGNIEIMPNPLNVGDESNVMFSVFNKGKATLYNLSVVLPENGPLEANEYFVGNVGSGESKDIDFMVKALEATEEDIPFQITFEDAEGNITKLEQNMKLTIQEAMYDDPYSDGMMNDDFDNYSDDINAPSSLPVWAIALIVIAAVIIVIIILNRILKARKKKKEQEEIDEMD